MKMNRRERKIYIKTINNIGKTLSDPAVIKAIEAAKELEETREDNDIGEEAGNNENAEIDS